uniref:Uncharacterized protein n=1 Tax=Glossina palpalis gambiensis TaxID=67801 RepID=A0A1B0BUE3_9MUSC
MQCTPEQKYLNTAFREAKMLVPNRFHVFFVDYLSTRRHVAAVSKHLLAYFYLTVLCGSLRSILILKLNFALAGCEHKRITKISLKQFFRQKLSTK